MEPTDELQTLALYTMCHLLPYHNNKVTDRRGRSTFTHHRKKLIYWNFPWRKL